MMISSRLQSPAIPPAALASLVKSIHKKKDFQKTEKEKAGNKANKIPN